MNGTGTKPLSAAQLKYATAADSGYATLVDDGEAANVGGSALPTAAEPAMTGPVAAGGKSDVPPHVHTAAGPPEAAAPQEGGRNGTVNVDTVAPHETISQCSSCTSRIQHSSSVPYVRCGVCSTILAVPMLGEFTCSYFQSCVR